MDFSGSMRSEKDNLHSTATDIANAIKDISPDYTIGFGGFCDKPILKFGHVSKILRQILTFDLARL